MQLSSGQAPGLFQTAFVVPDIEAGMRRHIDALGIGPWFLLERFTPNGALYRGRPTSIVMSVAFAYSGDMMLELIQQHDDTPSVFREIVDRRGYGMHHIGFAVPDYETALAEHRTKGWVCAFSANTTGRLVMLESEEFPHMVELLEMNPKRMELFFGIRAASRTWDGADPVRALPGGGR